MDLSESLKAYIVEAEHQDLSVQISGQGSKSAWLPEVDGEMLNTLDHVGIESYEPDELVIKARCGTPLKELRRLLAQENQLLPPDPPEFGDLGTVGGAIASGFSGPARPWRGALRDSVLGVELINGRGELMRFGGQVMKNVAGYDVSRLNTGAFGSLGLLLNVSLRVAPQPDHEATLRYELSAEEALTMCRHIALKPYPVTGTFWHGGCLNVRLSGTEQGINAVMSERGGEQIESQEMWTSIRDHRHVAFSVRDGGFLCRVIAPPSAPLPEGCDVAVEWGGGLRWVHTEEPAAIEAYAEKIGGWNWTVGAPVEISSGQRQLMKRIKHAFDPNGTFLSPLDLGDSNAH